MPIATTKKAAKSIERRVRRACEEVREEWTRRERRHRRLEAFQMQNQLAKRLGLAPALIPVRASR